MNASKGPRGDEVFKAGGRPVPTVSILSRRMPLRIPAGSDAVGPAR